MIVSLQLRVVYQVLIHRQRHIRRLITSSLIERVEVEPHVQVLDVIVQVIHLFVTTSLIKVFRGRKLFGGQRWQCLCHIHSLFHEGFNGVFTTH